MRSHIAARLQTPKDVKQLQRHYLGHPAPLLWAYLFWELRMDRFVITVDAGYMLHTGVEIVSKRASTERRALELTDPLALICTTTGATPSGW